MSKNAVVSLTLQIKGNADQKIKQMADAQVKAVKQVNTESQKLRPIQEAQVQTAKKILVELQKQGTALVQQSKEAKAVELTRKLGLRTEQQIKGEIQQSHAIYQKLGILQRQGVITAKDMERSYAAMKSKVAALNAELGKTAQKEKQIQQLQRQGGGFGNRFQGAVATGGAIAAGGMVVSSALQKPRDYDQQLTYITATATGGQGLSTAERLKSKETLNGYIKTAVRNGGGTREDAAEAANALIASGKYDLNTVAPALNSAVKTAFSTGADAKDAATLTVRMQDFGLTDLQKGHDIAVRGAQLGSFEYKDQAKWLAQQMAAAKAAGYSGEKGFVELVAMNQVAMSTAATTDEGGNNLVNLLAKLSSSDFSNTVAKAVENTDGLPTKAIKNKKGKVVGQEFDWTTYSMAEREKGVYGVDAFIKLLERQLAGNSEYQDLQKKIASTTNNEERKSILEDMSNIASGSQLGEFLADRQALMAALAVYYKKDELNEMRTVLPNAGGTVASEYDFVSQSESSKNQAMLQEKLFAQSKAYDAVSDSLGDFKDMVTDAARNNEKLAAAAYTAATAVATLAAASAVGMVLSGGKGGKVAGAAGSLAKRGGSAVLGAAGPAGAVAVAGIAGYGAGTLISKNFVEGTAAGDKIGEVIAKTLAVFGNEDAKAAVEAQRAYDAMLAEQARNNQLSAELNNKLGTLIDVTRSNKPLPFNLPNGGTLAESFGRGSVQENRHGAAKPFMLQHTGR